MVQRRSFLSFLGLSGLFSLLPGVPRKANATIADWNDPATWARWYEVHPRRISSPATESELILNYSRVVLQPRAMDLAIALETAFGWSPTPVQPTIGFLGAGYAWTVEALETMGYTRVVGTDISSFIQTTQTDTEEADIDAAITAAGLDPSSGRGLLHKNAIWTDPGTKGRSSRGVLNEGASTPGSRNRLKNSIGLLPNEDVDWLLSEYLVEVATDAEILSQLATYDDLGTNIVHIIQGGDGTNSQPDGNWKGTAGWRTFLDDNGFSTHQL